MACEARAGVTNKRPATRCGERAGGGGIRATGWSLTAAIVRIGSHPGLSAAPARGGASAAATAATASTATRGGAAPVEWRAESRQGDGPDGKRHSLKMRTPTEAAAGERFLAVV